MTPVSAKLETNVLWREFHQLLAKFVSRRVSNPADVEDILQEVFLRLHRHINTIRARDRLPAWIFQIARNAIIDHYRANDRSALVPSKDLDQIAVIDKEGEDRQAFNDLSTCIESMIAALPPIYREALELTDLRGFTQVEAAAFQNISVSGMKSRVQRARRELKAMLLACCHVEQDRRGSITDYSVRDIRKAFCRSCRRP